MKLEGITDGRFFIAMMVCLAGTAAARAASLELCIGDSITNGHQESNPSNARESYPHLFALRIGANSFKQAQTNKYVLPEGPLLDIGSPVTVVNYGIEGQTLNSMLDNFSSQVLPHAQNYQSTTINLLGGANNSYWDTPQNINQLIRSYVALAHQHNIPVRVMTMSLTGPPQSQQTYNTILAANSLLRADHSFADGFVDLGRNEAFIDASNSTYFVTSDGVHLRYAANQIFAELVAAERAGTYSVPVIPLVAQLPPGQVGVAYQGTLQASGGMGGSIIWRHIGGAVPPGLVFNGSAGRFEGQPQQAGSFDLVFRAVDAKGNFDERSFTVTVAPASGGGGTLTNYALASQGASAMASSTYQEGGYNGAASNAIDGDRLFAGSNWGSTGGIFHGFGLPTWLEVDFPQSRRIQRVTLVTVRDSFTDKSPLQPGETFTTYGVTGFDIQAWNGSDWVTVQSVSGNNQVVRDVTLPAPVDTTKLRVLVTSTLYNHPRIAELEAWGTNP